MAEKQTSEDVSALAAKYLNLHASDLAADIGKAITESRTGLGDFIIQLAADIRTLAGSCLSQDETPDED